NVPFTWEHLRHKKWRKGAPLLAQQCFRCSNFGLGKQLRTACSSGGTVKDGKIEVQGDHCEQVIEALKKYGYSPKRAGG
ncbi:translation initiation factor 1 (eIF-1/SUI1), partial [Paraburkholderia sp. EB58]